MNNEFTILKGQYKGLKAKVIKRLTDRKKRDRNALTDVLGEIHVSIKAKNVLIRKKDIVFEFRSDGTKRMYVAKGAFMGNYVDGVEDGDNVLVKNFDGIITTSPYLLDRSHKKMCLFPSPQTFRAASVALYRSPSNNPSFAVDKVYVVKEGFLKGLKGKISGEGPNTLDLSFNGYPIIMPREPGIVSECIGVEVGTVYEKYLVRINSIRSNESLKITLFGDAMKKDADVEIEEDDLEDVADADYVDAEADIDMDIDIDDIGEVADYEPYEEDIGDVLENDMKDLDLHEGVTYKMKDQVNVVKAPVVPEKERKFIFANVPRTVILTNENYEFIYDAMNTYKSDYDRATIVSAAVKYLFPASVKKLPAGVNPRKVTELAKRMKSMDGSIKKKEAILQPITRSMASEQDIQKAQELAKTHMPGMQGDLLVLVAVILGLVNDEKFMRHISAKGLGRDNLGRVIEKMPKRDVDLLFFRLAQMYYYPSLYKNILELSEGQGSVLSRLYSSLFSFKDDRIRSYINIYEEKKLDIAIPLLKKVNPMTERRARGDCLSELVHGSSDKFTELVHEVQDMLQSNKSRQYILKHIRDRSKEVAKTMDKFTGDFKLARLSACAALNSVGGVIEAGTLIELMVEFLLNHEVMLSRISSLDSMYSKFIKDTGFVELSQIKFSKLIEHFGGQRIRDKVRFPDYMLFNEDAEDYVRKYAEDASQLSVTELIYDVDELNSFEEFVSSKITKEEGMGTMLEEVAAFAQYYNAIREINVELTKEYLTHFGFEVIDGVVLNTQLDTGGEIPSKLAFLYKHKRKYLEQYLERTVKRFYKEYMEGRTVTRPSLKDFQYIANLMLELSMGDVSGLLGYSRDSIIEVLSDTYAPPGSANFSGALRHLLDTVEGDNERELVREFVSAYPDVDRVLVENALAIKEALGDISSSRRIRNIGLAGRDERAVVDKIRKVIEMFIDKGIIKNVYETEDGLDRAGDEVDGLSYKKDNIITRSRKRKKNAGADDDSKRKELCIAVHIDTILESFQEIVNRISPSSLEKARFAFVSMHLGIFREVKDPQGNAMNFRTAEQWGEYIGPHGAELYNALTELPATPSSVMTLLTPYENIVFRADPLQNSEVYVVEEGLSKKSMGQLRDLVSYMIVTQFIGDNASGRGYIYNIGLTETVLNTYLACMVVPELTLQEQYIAFRFIDSRLRSYISVFRTPFQPLTPCTSNIELYYNIVFKRFKSGNNDFPFINEFNSLMGFFVNGDSVGQDNVEKATLIVRNCFLAMTHFNLVSVHDREGRILELENVAERTKYVMDVFGERVGTRDLALAVEAAVSYLSNNVLPYTGFDDALKLLTLVEKIMYFSSNAEQMYSLLESTVSDVINGDSLRRILYYFNGDVRENAPSDMEIVVETRNDQFVLDGQMRVASTYSILERYARNAYSGVCSAMYVSEENRKNIGNEFVSMLNEMNLQTSNFSVMLFSTNNQEEIGAKLDVYKEAFGAMRAAGLVTKTDKDKKIMKSVLSVRASWYALTQEARAKLLEKVRLETQNRIVVRDQGGINVLARRVADIAL